MEKRKSRAMRLGCASEDAAGPPKTDPNDPDWHWNDSRNRLLLRNTVTELPYEEIRPGVPVRMVFHDTREPMKCAVCGGQFVMTMLLEPEERN